MTFILGMIAGAFLLAYLAMGFVCYCGMLPRGGLHWILFWPVMLVYEYTKWRIREKKDGSV
jgi:hypothetical protein